MSSAYNLSLGPMELGNAFNCILFGVVCVQYYQYVVTFNDPKWLRHVIAFIFILDTAQTAIVMYMVWNYTVTYYDVPQHVKAASWIFPAVCFLVVPISWVVQWFFAWRIYQLGGRRRLIPYLIIFLSVISGFTRIGRSIGGFMVTGIQGYHKLQPPALIWFVCAIVADVIIAAATLWYLLSARTGFRDTDQLIIKICRGVVETGLVTTTIIILDAIFYYRMHSTNMHYCVALITGKTYSNSMLYLLNARRGYRTICRGGESPGHPSFVEVGLDARNEKKHDLTTIVFERPCLRDDGSFATSHWLESGLSDENKMTTSATAGNAQRENNVLARAPSRESKDTSESVNKFGVRSLPLAHLPSKSITVEQGSVVLSQKHEDAHEASPAAQCPLDESSLHPFPTLEHNAQQRVALIMHDRKSAL